MNTRNNQKEIQGYIKQYKRLKNEDLQKLLKEIEETGGTFSDRKKNKLRAHAIKTLLL